MTDSARLVSLAFIVHIVGDIHCPKHIRYADEPTSGGYPIKYHGKNIKYHGYWDATLLLAYHPWGYLDLAKLIDRYSKREREEIAKGDIFTWAEENARNSRFTVERREGFEITRAIANEDVKYAEQQLVRAGYRLAAVLNSLFE